jgi:hypothetical protein
MTNEYDNLLLQQEIVEMEYYPSKNKKIIWLIILSISIIICNHIYSYPKIESSCYYDPLFQFTKDTNEYYSKHESEKNSLIILASLLVDILLYYNVYLWVYESKDWILISSIILFYALRQLLLILFVIKFPDGYIYSNPGFPSLTVSYFYTNDFFYSGHIGLPILLFLENKSKGRGNIICGFCILVFIIEFYSMLITHGHYSIDLIAAILIAYYSYKLCERKNINFNKIFALRRELK